MIVMLMRSQYSKGAGRPFISHLQDMLDLVWFEQCITEDGRGLVTSVQSFREPRSMVCPHVERVFHLVEPTMEHHIGEPCDIVLRDDREGRLYSTLV